MCSTVHTIRTYVLIYFTYIICTVCTYILHNTIVHVVFYEICECRTIVALYVHVVAFSHPYCTCTYVRTYVRSVTSTVNLHPFVFVEKC